MTQQVQRVELDKTQVTKRLPFDLGQGARHDWPVVDQDLIEGEFYLSGVEQAHGNDLSAKRGRLARHDPHTTHATLSTFEQHDAEATRPHLRSADVTSTRQRVLSEVEGLYQRFAGAGFSIYLVGGIVRDLELGVAIDDLDFDLTTDATPEQIRDVVGPVADDLWTQGERFGTIGCRISGRDFEITTHRADTYVETSRKPEVLFGDDIEVDLSRRDFTINAMAMELPGGRLLDPFEGRAALTARTLDTPTDPLVSFGDDPLRILRAARFVARYQLTVAADVVVAAVELVGRIEIVSAERIRDELDKLLTGERPSGGFEFLDRVGALLPVFPRIGSDQWEAIGAELDAAPNNLDIRRCVVFGRLPSGERSGQLAALRYSNDERRSMLGLLAGSDMIRVHTGPWSDPDLRRLVDSVGYDSMPTLLGLISALSDTNLADLLEDLKTAFDRLDAAEDLTSFAPMLTGDDIMAEFGLDPGPEVGRLIAKLRAHRIENGPQTLESELDVLS